MDDKSKDTSRNDLLNLIKLLRCKSTEFRSKTRSFLPTNDNFTIDDGKGMSGSRHKSLFVPLENNLQPKGVNDFFVKNCELLNRRLMKKKFTNPEIDAVFKKAQPTFELIENSIKSFNTLAMNLEIMYMSTYLLFHGVLRIADYYTRGRSFLLKICSVNEWLKLALWFLTKLGRLLKIMGNRPTAAAAEVITTSEEMQPPLEKPPTADGKEDVFSK